MKHFKLALLLIAAMFCTARAQVLTHDRMSTMAYEDLSDWIRRLPGLYPMDYGVAGAPVIFRPWNTQPWMLGAQRDGIPWNRVSDGLYDSNLDSPEGIESIGLRFDGLSPMGTLDIRGRSLPNDSATTEVVLREGYYGFGRVDFAHAQKFSDKLSAEGRGRLFWYDGLRFETSKSRFYNLSGKLNAKLSEKWNGSLEYGGSDVDAQAPVAFKVDEIFRRPQIYSEREYGTAKLNRNGDVFDVEFGLHARQDRENRDPYFGLREKFWYGYAEGKYAKGQTEASVRIAGELADFVFPGVDQTSENAIVVNASAHHDFKFLDARARLLRRTKTENARAFKTNLDDPDESIWASVESKKFAGLSAVAEASKGRKSAPQFWLYANYPTYYRDILVDDRFADSTYYGGHWQGFEARYEQDEFYVLSGGLNFSHGSTNAQVRWTRLDTGPNRFLVSNDTLFYYMGDHGKNPWQGPSLDCDVALTKSFRLQSTSFISVDINGLGRAIDTRSFSRLLFNRDFFKSPLHITSYIAHEMIGNHDAVSEYEAHNVGPTHMLHFRVEGTIEGVTLIWGVENLTGQHYQYLPGFTMISKEEYFGMRWILKL